MAQQPKRPLTSYFIWLGEHRDSIKNENPDLAAKDIAKMAGELWRAISDSEKIVSITFRLQFNLTCSKMFALF